MKNRILRPILLAVFLLFYVFLFADNYQDQSKKLRKEVWAWDKPEFNNYTVSDQYKNESAVIIAWHRQIKATVKKNVFMNIMYFGDYSHPLFYSDIDRIMIKINDQTALNEYSQLSFKEEDKSLGYYQTNKSRTIIGARVVKPDGSIKEINVDDAVSINEGKNEKTAYKKLAIPNLQVGDILDYFYYNELQYETRNLPSQIIALYSRYPIQSYSAHCEFNKKLTVEYHSINGAPEFNTSIDKAGNTVLELSTTKTNKFDNVDDMRFMSPYRDLPMVRLAVLNSSSKFIYKPASARKAGVYKNVSYENILNDAKGVVASQSKAMYWMTEINKKVKPAIANFLLMRPNCTKEELANYIFGVLRFYWPGDYANYPSTKFLVRLQQLFKENNIENKLVFSTTKYGTRRDDVFNAGDFELAITANNNRQFFSLSEGYVLFGYVPGRFEGEIASTVVVDAYKSNQKNGIEGRVEDYKIPETTYQQNKERSITDVRFNGSDPLQLVFSRNTTKTGDLKEPIQSLLLLYEDWDKAMREHLMIKQSFMEELQEDKSQRKHINEYQSYFEAKRKEQKDTIKAEITSYHSLEPKEVIDYKINSLGVIDSSPEFSYEINYILEGLVKKAGDNLILDAGKLIGSQWVPTEKERNRTVDAYTSTVRMFENEIRIQIPNGYMVQGLEVLHYTMDNEYGSFESEASQKDHTIVIKTKKIYKKSFIPKNDWPKLLEMIDQANDFCAQSLVLKK